jgi:uncharacterized protein YgiM (DUF1202 family)
MTEMNKISFEALEEITGGKIVTVANDAVNYANIRHTPGLNGKVAAKVYNGTKLRTTGLRVTKDGYVWYEVTLLDGSDNAWIAGSLIGF